MVMKRWDPFHDLRRIDNLFGRVWRGAPSRRYTEDGVESWNIPVDVLQEGDDIAVRGVKPDDLHVTIEDGVLTIAGESQESTEKQDGNFLMRERRTGGYHRALRLPNTVDTENVESNYENGILTIRLPKLETKKARRIEVKAK